MTLPLCDKPPNGEISHSGNKAKKTVATFVLTTKFSRSVLLSSDQHVDLKLSCSAWQSDDQEII